MKKGFILAALVAATFPLCAQTTRDMPNTWHLSFDLMANVPNTLQDPFDVDSRLNEEDADLILGAASLEWSRQVNQWLETGLYLSIKEGGTLHSASTTVTVNSNGDTTIVPHSEWFTRYPSVGFGLTARVHLMPLAGKKESKWDFYFVGNIGGWLCGSVRKDYGFGGGAAWMPTKHFGLFTECMFGSYQSAYMAHLMKSDGILRIGLMLRL